ncbi:VWA domain-containing protein [Novosphingobium sp. 11B]
MPLDISFLHPQAACLLLALPLLWWKARRAGLPQKVLRTALSASLIVALMQPSLIHRAEGARRVLVIDRGTWASARADATGKAMEDRVLADAMSGAAHLSLIEIGSGPPILGDQPRLAKAVFDHVVLPGEALSAALDEALARIPVGATGSVLVAGSGRSLDRDWGRAVSGFLDRRIPVNAVVLDDAPRDAFVADLAVAPVRVGELARAHVRVEGTSTDAPLRVAIYSGTRRLALSHPFAVQGETSADLAFPTERAGFMPLRAVLVDGANEATPAGGLNAVVAVQDPVHMLYLGERQQGGGSRLQTLLGRTVKVDARTPSALGGSEEPGDWQSVMIDDMPASRIPAALQKQLLDAVAGRGTGLFYAGGAGAFATGGYAGTPLAGALPLKLRQDEKVERPSVALVVVIDTSGSMQGDPIDLAKQVARFAVAKLTPADQVGVVEFYGAKQWSVPLQQATDVPAVERAIGRMQAQGSSILYPAIQEAYYALKSSPARFKHILVISDAGVEEQRYQQLLTQAAQDRITVSTALVGANPDGEERMAEWARWGHGRYYAVADPFSLVEIDLKQPQDKPSPAWREGSFALAAPGGAAKWQGVKMTGLPALDGYVTVARRSGADVLLQTGSGDPLLTSWQYGNGRITALMTTPVGEGTRSWSAWGGYGEWLAKLVTRTADQNAAGVLTLRRGGDRLNVVLRTPVAPATMPTARLAEHEGVPSRPIALEEMAPGIFAGSIALDQDVPALVDAKVGAATIRAVDRGRAAGDAAERLPLDELARLTGGDASGTAPAPHWTKGSEIAATDLSRWFALFALVLYLCEVVCRRWPGHRPVFLRTRPRPA